MKKLTYLLSLVLFLTACGGSEVDGDIDDIIEEDNIPFVSYSTEYGTCLSSSNSEAFLNYSDIGGENITLIWNCADYEGYGSNQFHNSYIELSFSKYEDPQYGACYQFTTDYVAEGICDARATAPADPLYTGLIESVTMGPKSGDEIPFSLTMKNTGNVTLLNVRITVIFEGVFYADYGEYPYTERTLMQGADFHVGIDSDYNLPERSLLADDVGDTAYDVTVILSIGGGQVLDVYYLTYYPY